MERYQCQTCGYIYDEMDGDLIGGVLPGTTWDEVPEDWHCPVCGAEKETFKKLEGR